MQMVFRGDWRPSVWIAAQAPCLVQSDAGKLQVVRADADFSVVLSGKEVIKDQQ